LADIYEKEEMDKTEIEQLKGIINRTEAIKENLQDLMKMANANKMNITFNEDIESADSIIKEANNTLDKEASIVMVYRKNDTIPNELRKLENELSKIKDDLNHRIHEYNAR
jgi:hypothetical protein